MISVSIDKEFSILYLSHGCKWPHAIYDYNIVVAAEEPTPTPLGALPTNTHLVFRQLKVYATAYL